MKFSIFTKKAPAPEAVQDSIQVGAPTGASTGARKRRMRNAHLPARQPTPAQVKSENNQRRVLEILARFGIVDTHFIGLSAFNRYKQRYEMARRTLQNLHKQGLIAVRMGVHGSRVYVLTDSGAEIASRIVGDTVTGGMHLRTPTSPTLLHRLLGSYHLIHYASYLMHENIPFEYLTERELETHLCRSYIDRRSLIGKRRPDALVLFKNEHDQDAIWVEVERGYKTHKRFDEQLSALLKMMDRDIAPKDKPEVMLRAIQYVADPSVVNILKLRADIIKVSEAENCMDLIDRIFVYRAHIKNPYYVESLCGLTIPSIPETLTDIDFSGTPDEAIESEFDMGHRIRFEDGVYT